MVGMLVRVSRGGRSARARRVDRLPEIGHIQDLLNEEFRSPPSLLQLSSEAGVYPDASLSRIPGAHGHNHGPLCLIGAGLLGGGATP
jgi:hypothetical protein